MGEGEGAGGMRIADGYGTVEQVVGAIRRRRLRLVVVGKPTSVAVVRQSTLRGKRSRKAGDHWFSLDRQAARTA